MSLDFVRDELARLRAQGRHRTLRWFAGPPEPETVVDGREVLLFASNNYLGLATHPDVVRAAQEAAAEWGTGSGGSRLLSGSTELHFALEAELARLKGTEDAVLFGTGYQANLGTITALSGPGHVVASDRLNHASLIDACRLARADVRVYEHADPPGARKALARTSGRGLLVTDGVFSMDGDEAPLALLADAAQESGSALMVDDAHGTGVLGGGAGTVHAQGVQGRVDAHMGTLSKALASEGGFVAGGAELCDILRNTARPFMFSTAPAPPSVAAALAALRVVRREPGRVERLLANARRVREGLRGIGLTIPAGRTPIVPVVLGSEDRAMAVMERLLGDGIYAGAVRPPTVAVGSCRLRITVMATHTEEHIARLVEAVSRALAADREAIPSLASS